MQPRRPTGVSPLAIVLPHPSLPSRRSSLLSAASVSSPHTPRSCGSPTCSSIFFSPASNRKSTDSWNSSNQDLADDLAAEWKPEQTLLLSRTLDALPAHLITPYSGVPPSNLLDKVARGVSHAKGPSDWPHSIRATRVKLAELARIRAKEEALANESRRVIAEEDDDAGYFVDSTNVGSSLVGRPQHLQPRRPLYRQSSMDFMNVSTAKPDFRDNDAIGRLSSRLQRTDRLIPNPTFYHPYPRIAPSSSTLNSTSTSSTSSSSNNTLSTADSISSRLRPRNLRRSVSTLATSTSSTSHDIRTVMPANVHNSSSNHINPMQRNRRAESFCIPTNSDVSPRMAVKRAPSFGALAQEARVAAPKSEDNGNANAYPSSDEEEKLRSRGAKKPRVRAAIPNFAPVSTSPPTSSPSSPMGIKSPKAKSKSPPSRLDDPVQLSPSLVSKKSRMVKTPSPPPFAEVGVKRLRANLQRNPSILGPELPALPAESAQIPLRNLAFTPSTPAPRKTLRRVRRLAPARKIEFGSCVADETLLVERKEGKAEETLGSAFQLA